jgi:hypothetical protein
MKSLEWFSFKNKSFLILFYSGIILAGIAYKFFDPYLNGNSFLPICPLYKSTGLFCTGCGTQRALHEIYNGQFLNAIHQNLLFTIIYLLCIFDFILILLKKEKIRPFTLLSSYKKLSLAILVIVIVFTVTRNINIPLFQLLAPTR